METRSWNIRAHDASRARPIASAASRPRIAVEPLAPRPRRLGSLATVAADKGPVIAATSPAVHGLLPCLGLLAVALGLRYVRRLRRPTCDRSDGSGWALAAVGHDPEMLEEVLAVAKEAALGAGELIRRAWGSGVGRAVVKTTKSSGADLLTATDEAAEKLIVGLIKAKYPTHLIIGEEGSGSSRYELTPSPTWTIDPVDGTTNFVHRWPWTCVLIAFCVDREPVVSVTYDPIGESMYWATKGGGAFLKSPRYEGPLRASGTDNLRDALVIMEAGYWRDPAAVQRLSRTLAGLLRRQVRTVRMAGSAGLNLAAVASGQADAILEEGSWATNTGTKIWDFAGGKLLVEEAGGVLRDPSGGPFDLTGRSILAAASPALAQQLIEVLKEAAQPDGGDV